MRHLVSSGTSFECCGTATRPRLLGSAVHLRALQHTYPGVRKYATGIRVVAAARARAPTDLCSPGAGLSGAVVNANCCAAQAIITSLAKGGGAVRAGLGGDLRKPGLGDVSNIGSETLVHAAQIGKNLSRLEGIAFGEGRNDLATSEVGDGALEPCAALGELSNLALERPCKSAHTFAWCLGFKIARVSSQRF